MTGSHPDPRTPDDDLDPTGVRALLANLPDPGPMPDELVERISQSLELEQERRGVAGGDRAHEAPGLGATSSGDGTVSPDRGSVVSLTAERRRRRPGRTVLWLGGAAAVAMVATVSVNQLVGDDTADSGVAANVPATTDSADSGAEAGGAADEDAADAPGASELDDSDAHPTDSLAEPPPPGLSPSDEEGAGDVSSSVQVHAAAGTVELTSTDWADEVSVWLTADLSRGESTWGLMQARECIADGGLDTGHANRVVLSDAMWADEPVTLVVAEASAGDTAWLLTPDCRDVLSGPTPLD